MIRRWCELTRYLWVEKYEGRERNNTYNVIEEIFYICLLLKSVFNVSLILNAVLYANPAPLLCTQLSSCSSTAIALHTTSPRSYNIISAMLQLGSDSTHKPSGMYRRTIKGIFFSLNSLIAICSGSVSPSKSTSTGAFILETLLDMPPT